MERLITFFLNNLKSLSQEIYYEKIPTDANSPHVVFNFSAIRGNVTKEFEVLITVRAINDNLDLIKLTEQIEELFRNKEFITNEYLISTYETLTQEISEPNPSLFKREIKIVGKYIELD